MSIEDSIFKRAKLKTEALIPYGFVKHGKIYKYERVFMDHFRVNIEIDEQENVKGKVYDITMEEEYINFRMEHQMGEFVNRVREEYTDILKDIRNNCFTELNFITDQANRITKKIIETYHNEPEFIWDKFPGYGIFRNPNNAKWYGIILNIDRSKIEKNQTGEVEIINLKLENDKIANLLKKKGFYPSYHMNKKNWITIILDNTISDEEIMQYVYTSHNFTETTNEWIIPANPQYYDVINCFNEREYIEWKQSSNVLVGDIVYIYVASPYSAILYKCQATKVNIPYTYKDKNLTMKYVMNLKRLETYDVKKYPFSKLKEYGVKAIRGPRRMPEKLSKEIKNNKFN